MSPHLFSIGERVSLSSSMRSAALQADVFVVQACMPVVGSHLQYRIRTASEPYDRVVTEEQLTKLASDEEPSEP